MAKLSAY